MNNLRLDIYISEKFPELSRSQAKKLIESGYVKIDGDVCKKPAQKLADGAKVQVEMPKPQSPEAEAEDIPLDIIYEDQDIIVVNKPAGMVVHPAAGNPRGTLVNALLSHCKDLSGIGGVARPGIVHRLDKGTSGVMVIAKNDFAHLNLSAQFKERKTEKKYLALVFGKIPKDEGLISVAIGRHVSERKKMSTKTKKGRVAETYYKVLKRFGTDITLVDIKLGTGRTHQIRVHFSHIGHPLIGDELYGGNKSAKRIKDKKILDTLKIISRPALHSYRLGLNHPRTGERKIFEAKIPEDIEELINALSNI